MDAGLLADIVIVDEFPSFGSPLIIPEVLLNSIHSGNPDTLRTSWSWAIIVNSEYCPRVQ